MRRMLRYTSAALTIATCLASCAPVRVNSYAVPTTDLRSYRSYAWDGAELGQTGDPRLDNNGFFKERVQQAADAQMAFRGYEKMSSGTPDLVLHVHARVGQRIDSAELDDITGVCTDECRSYVYDEGTILIDIVDGRTSALIWRGWAERSLDRIVDDQAWMNQTIDGAISLIFARLPVRHLSGGRPYLARTD
jgi:hypothetical protein